MLQYILEVTLCWTLFYAIFFALLRKVTFYRVNRWYLLGALIAGILIPLLSFIDIDLHQEQVAQAAPLVYVVKEAPAFIANTVIEQTTDWQYIIQSTLLGLYLIGLTFFLIRFLKGLTTIYSLYTDGSKTHHDHHTVVNTSQPHLPFSFLNKIFISQKLPLKGDIDDILRHEMAHVKGNHSLDVLLLELINIIFWFHPLVYLYKTAIRQTHEYLADAVVLESTSRKIYGNILLKQSLSGLEVALAHHFFHSHIKKRINMMYQKKSGQSAWLKYSLALPILILLFVVFSGYQSQEVYTTEDLIKEWQIDCEGSYSVFPTKIYADIEEYKSKADYLREYTFTEGFLDVINNYDPKHSFLIVFNGEIVTDNLSDFISLDRDITAESMTILIKEIATEKYGDLGKNGALEFITEKKPSDDIFRLINDFINSNGIINLYEGEKKYFTSVEEEIEYRSQFNSIEVYTKKSSIDKILGVSSETPVVSNYFNNNSGQVVRINEKPHPIKDKETLVWNLKLENINDKINIRIENQEGLLNPIFKYHGDEDLNTFTISESTSLCDKEAMLDLFSYLDQTDQTKIPLVFIDDKEITLPLSNYIDRSKTIEMETIEWMCPVPAMEEYGTRGENGVVKLYGISSSSKPISEKNNKDFVKLTKEKSNITPASAYRKIAQPGEHIVDLNCIGSEVGPFDLFKAIKQSNYQIVKLRAEANSFGLLKETNQSNILKESVVVTANNFLLKENIDYTVDFNTGILNIINSTYKNKDNLITVTFAYKNDVRESTNNGAEFYADKMEWDGSAGITKLTGDVSINFQKDTLPLIVINNIVKGKGNKYFENLSPDDIEHINVLKGEAAITKYGDQASDGVIEVHTKSILAQSDTIYRGVTDMPLIGKSKDIHRSHKTIKEYIKNNFRVNENMNIRPNGIWEAVTITIEKNGEASHIQAVGSETNSAIKKEAVRVIKEMSDDLGWQVGKDNGIKRRVQFYIPIKVPFDKNQIAVSNGTNKDPLFVFNGVITENRNSIEVINSKDVDIKFLDDEKGIEIYGQKGKYGVVLMTTQDKNIRNEGTPVKIYGGYKLPANRPEIQLIIDNRVFLNGGEFFGGLEMENIKDMNSLEQFDYVAHITPKNKSKDIRITTHNREISVKKEGSLSVVTIHQRDGSSLFLKAKEIHISESEGIGTSNNLAVSLKPESIEYDTTIIFDPETFTEAMMIEPSDEQPKNKAIPLNSSTDTVVHLFADPKNNLITESIVFKNEFGERDTIFKKYTHQEYYQKFSPQEKIRSSMRTQVLSFRSKSDYKGEFPFDNTDVSLKGHIDRSGDLTVKYTSPTKEHVTFFVHSLRGKLIEKRSLSYQDAHSGQQFQLSKDITRVVIITSQQGDKIRSEKVLIAK